MQNIHPQRTYAYKEIRGKSLQLDVYFPEGEASTQPRPAILHFHGGFLMTGDRTSVAPWIIQAALKRNWTLISADYRLLPESTGVDIAADAADAYDWVARRAATAMPDRPIDQTRIVVAGWSAGGFPALLNATREHEPAPVALLLVYPQTYIGADVWRKRGPYMGFTLRDPAPALSAIESRIAQGEVCFGEVIDVSKPITEHSRWPEIQTVKQEGLVLDFLTGIKGITEAVDLKGLDEAIPDHLRYLFALDFGVPPSLPPLFVAHGDADTIVPVGLSEKLVKSGQELGVKANLLPVDGKNHLFDFAYKDVEVEGQDDPAALTLARALEALDGHLDVERTRP